MLHSRSRFKKIEFNVNTLSFSISFAFLVFLIPYIHTIYTVYGIYNSGVKNVVLAKDGNGNFNKYENKVDLKVNTH